MQPLSSLHYTSSLHFTIGCRMKISNVQEIKHNIEEYNFGSLIEENEIFNSWFANLKICDSSLKVKIDTGADIAVISHKTYKSLLNRPPLRTAEGILEDQAAQKKTSD